MLNCSICGDVADLILALVEEDGTILLIDSITNQILTRIPTEKSIIRILFDTDSTGIFACTQDGNVFYYPLNNCLHPAFGESENASTGGGDIKSKIWSLFACCVCWKNRLSWSFVLLCIVMLRSTLSLLSNKQIIRNTPKTLDLHLHNTLFETSLSFIFRISMRRNDFGSTISTKFGTSTAEQ